MPAKTPTPTQIGMLVLYGVCVTDQEIPCNGTARFKNVNNCLNTNIYSYLETSGCQSYNLYLNIVNFFQHQR